MIRISATIPDDVLAAADAHAARVDRSRSWVISEALRGYLKTLQEPAERTAGLDPSRLAQLRADLGLSPEQRVKEAERTLREYEATHENAGNPLIVFDSFEEYFVWDRRESLR
jgi:hypothetical protein